jgi:ribosomal protein S18 acetylase RimI-like enzyme
MNVAIDYLSNMASEAQVTEHLLSCDANFVASLSHRVKITDYAEKIVSNATRFEAWSNGMLVALVAAYCNNQETRIAHITNVSVTKAWTRKGIAANLMDRCIEHARAVGMRRIELEVAVDNMLAIKLYKKSGFVADKSDGPLIQMKLDMKSEERS